jgi:HD-GYP domain-containing protein (c-di-GMP phosphodiesterase class II)
MEAANRTGVSSMGLRELRRRLMNLEEPKPRKRIPLSQLKPGMHVVELDRPWLETPFIVHRMLIKNMRDVVLLEQHGIRDVVIELEPEPDREGIKREIPNSSDGQFALGGQTPPEKNAVRADEQVILPLMQELTVAKSIHQEALAAVQSIFDGAGRGLALNIPTAKETVHDLLSSVTRSPEASILLMQMRRFQNDLFTHALNVCILSLVVGMHERLPGDIAELGLGALLHDVGLVRLPRNVIRKLEGLTQQERRLVEQHPALSATIVDEAKHIAPAVRRIVLEHHERLNGTGYPARKTDTYIHPLSQIVAITDVYDAMITGRCGVAQPPIDVLRQLYLDANAGAFDRDLVERVIRSLGVYPVGSLVELNTGERGIVLAANRKDTLKPTIRLVLSRDGLPLARGPIVSLAEEESVAIGRQIRRSLDPGRERIDILSHLRLATELAA